MLSVGRVMEQSALTYANAPKSSEQVSEKNTSTLAADNTDEFVRNGASFTPAYTKATVTDNRSGTTGDSTNANSSAAGLAAGRNAAQAKAADNKTQQAAADRTGANSGVRSYVNTKQAKNDLMRDMVYNTINSQRANTNKTSVMNELDEILNAYGLADEAENDPDFWNAENTANRILDFAKNLANGDSELLDTLQGAFEKGFKEVEGYFGGTGKLPGVSYDTYDRVTNGFKDLKDELNSAADAVAAAQS